MISNVSATTSSSAFYKKILTWEESLYQASEEGNLHKIKSIMKCSSKTLANLPEEFARCFIIAVEKGHKDIIDFFLSLGAVKIISLKWLVHGLNSGLEQDPVLESHKEIVDMVINSIKSDKESGIIPECRLSEVFEAALANHCIKVVKALTKFIEPAFVYNALKSMIEKKYIESEDVTVFRSYIDPIKVTIDSLTPERSWKIIEIDAGVVNSGSTSHTKVIQAITESMDPSFLCNALKSCIEKKKAYAENPSVLGFYESLIRVTISSLTPELLYGVLISLSVDMQVTKTIVNSISAEFLYQVLHLSLEQGRAEVIKTIINSEHILHSDNYGKAFVQAVKKRQVDVVQLFINSRRFNALASDYFDEALEFSDSEIGQMIRNSDRGQTFDYNLKNNH